MYRKAALSLYVIFLSLSSVSAQEKYDPFQVFTAEELKKDYDEVVKTLLAVHPGLLSFQTFTEFRYKATIARSKIEDNMTVNDFYKIVSGMVNEVRCGHTFILPSLESIAYNKDKPINFPLVLSVSEEGAIVKKAFKKEDSVFVGKKLVSINGFLWDSIRDSLWNYIPADGFIPTRKDFLLSQNFEFFYRIFFGTPPVFEVSFEDTTVNLEAITYKEMARFKSRKPALETVFEKDSAYLKINTFSESKTYKKEVKKTFKKILKRAPDNLVIDLRENDGGSTENMIYVLAYILDKPFVIFDTVKVHNKASLESFFKEKKQIKHYVEQIRYDSLNRQYYWDDAHNLAKHKPRKKTFQGQITVLVGGGTFSSAVHFVTCLLNELPIVILGEETGGFADHNNGGVIPKVVLPNTKLRLSVPLFQGKYHVEFDFDKGRGIYPDPGNKSVYTD